MSCFGSQVVTWAACSLREETQPVMVETDFLLELPSSCQYHTLS